MSVKHPPTTPRKKNLYSINVLSVSLLLFSFDRHIMTTGILWTLRIGLVCVKPLAAGLLSCITYTRPHGSCYTALTIYILLKRQIYNLKLRYLGAQTDINFYINFDISFSSVSQFIAHAKSQHLGISNSYHLFIKGE